MIDKEYLSHVRQDITDLNRRHFASADAEDVGVAVQNMGELVLQMAEQVQALSVALQKAQVKLELLTGTLEIIELDD